MPGWEVVKYTGPGDGDPTILVGPDYQVIKTWSHRLTKFEQRRGPGGPPPAHATTALVEQRSSGKKFLVSVAHLPSHVEGKWYRRGYYRVFVWKDALKNWKAILSALRHQTGVKRFVIVADWNLNFKRKVFRSLMGRLFPTLRLTWSPPFPKDGTHHRRIIDGTVTNLRIYKKPRLYKDDASSDHRPYREILILS
jgi:hypothetical protein